MLIFIALYVVSLSDRANFCPAVFAHFNAIRFKGVVLNFFYSRSCIIADIHFSKISSISIPIHSNDNNLGEVR